MDHNEAMSRKPQQHRISGLREAPNEQITVTIRLNLSNESSQNNHASPSLQLDFSNLKNVLENDYNMEDITLEQDSEGDMDILKIRGIPPSYGFDLQQVLEVVQNYAPNAVLLPDDN